RYVPAGRRRLNSVVGVRHEVADVAVLRTEDRPTAPAVLPAVSHRDRKPRDNVASSLWRAAQAPAVTATASSKAVGTGLRWRPSDCRQKCTWTRGNSPPCTSAWSGSPGRPTGARPCSGGFGFAVAGSRC